MARKCPAYISLVQLFSRSVGCAWDLIVLLNLGFQVQDRALPAKLLKDSGKIKGIKRKLKDKKYRRQGGRKQSIDNRLSI